MMVDLPSETRTRVQVTKKPPRETWALLSSNFPAADANEVRTFEEPSIRTAHSSDSAGCPFVIGPMTRVTKSIVRP